MKFLLSRVAAGALALSYVSAPGSAATTSGLGIPQLPRASVDAARTKNSTAAAPCSTVLGPGFIGEPGAPSGYSPTNFVDYYSGVVAGLNNQACGSGANGIVAGNGNTASGGLSIIGAGASNTITRFGSSSFIGAGEYNEVNANFAGIAAGAYNTVQGQGDGVTGYSFIGGGLQNTIANAADFANNGMSSFIGAGSLNTVAANYGVLGGGYTNSVTADYGTVAGGFGNTATGVQSFVGGGFQNNASGKNGSIPGGTKNWANGINSFAAGTQAKAVQDGTFVWSDYVNGSNQVVSTGKNQFVARATGGFYLYSSTSLTGVALAPGSGAWSTLSDRNVKTGIENADDARVLAKLAAMPISEWSYKAQGTGVRHLGPMAQDFRAAFGLGEDDRHISTVDEEGVALAAIKALQAEVAEKDAQIAELRRAQTDARSAHSEADQRLEAKYARLEQRLDALESRGQPAAAPTAKS